MPPRRINHHQPHDSILARYHNFLENSRFDENGNAFSETVFRISRLPDWTLVKHRRLLTSVTHNGDPLRHKKVGPPLLAEIVRRFLNKNLKELSIEALQAVPWSIMKCIWEDALSSGQDNFRVWSLFASVYGDEPDFNSCFDGNDNRTRYRKVHLSRPVSIGSLINPISSPSFQWLVDLDLQRSSGYTRYDFLELPQIPNLAALNISRHHQDLDIDDGMIRTWSMAAANEGKFTMLKVLVARNHEQVTARSLEYLSWVGSLEVVDLTGCNFNGLMMEIRGFGWVNDSVLADIIEDPIAVWKIIRGEEEKEVEKLVLQVKIEASQPIPRRVGARTAMVFRRESNRTSTKRKQTPNPKPSPKIAPERIASAAKKPRVLRDYKKKDMGSLLAEFGRCGR